MAFVVPDVSLKGWDHPSIQFGMFFPKIISLSKIDKYT